MSKTTKALAILGVVAGLGVAALPISAMAANTEAVPHDVNLTLEIEEALSFTIDNVDDDKDVTLEGEGLTGLFDADPIDLYVETTLKEGYDLTMVGSTEDASSKKNVLVNENGTEIAGSGFTALSGTTSSWGYQKSEDTSSFSGNNYTAIPENSTSIRDSGGAAAAEHTFIKFGAYIAAGQEAGTYEGTVTFTASPAVD